MTANITAAYIAAGDNTYLATSNGTHAYGHSVPDALHKLANQIGGPPWSLASPADNSPPPAPADRPSCRAP